MSEDGRVYISVALEDQERLLRLAGEVADDLESYISNEYEYRDKYPVQMRKYERDMAVVIDLRKLLVFTP